MNDEKNGRMVEIPEEFHSFSKGKPFEQCIECDKHLLDDDTEYFIEKAVKKYNGFKAADVIFEYAICLDCAEKMRHKISKESMQSIEQYFTENVNMVNRLNIMQNHPDNPKEWTSECLIKGNEKNSLEEFQLYAHCKGTKMELGHMPYMICGAALDEITQILSTETLDELNGFLGKHFGPPPELEELLPTRRLVLI